MAEIAGLKLIVPTSVAGSGVSVSATGKVTFTSSTTINVNGCFTSSYDNYLVVCRFVSATSSSDLLFRMRASGSDNSSANSYTRQLLNADGSSVTGARASADSGRLSETSSTARSGFHTYFYGPNLAQPTAARSVTVSGRSSAWISDYAITHNQSTAYDGFSLFENASGALTGILTVYGLSQ